MKLTVGNRLFDSILILGGLGLWIQPATVRADQVIADDLIVQGSACIGLDCINNEDFGFDTVRLKENNIRIKFDDTSSSAGFPANDWQLTANDSASGGANKFSIEDITGAKVPFTVIAGAPTNSIFVDSSGRLGLRTATPVLDIHAQTGNTPALRLDQTNGSGFTAQTWDIGANEANFFVRDVTGGSRLPFRIRPGAPTSSIDISSTGMVGIGTSAPVVQWHTVKSAQTGAELIARIEIGDDTVGRLDINNASATDGTFIPRLQGKSASQNAALIMEGLITDDLGVGPAIVYNAAKISGGGISTRPLVVYRNNNVAKATITANGDINATSFNPVSSRTLKDKIVDLDSQRARDAIQHLNPVEYVYKNDETKEPRVGFIAEDVPDLVANSDRQSVPIMDVVALVTKVVKDQQNTIDDQRKTIDKLVERVNELESQIRQLK